MRYICSLAFLLLLVAGCTGYNIVPLDDDDTPVDNPDDPPEELEIPPDVEVPPPPEPDGLLGPESPPFPPIARRETKLRL